MNQPMIRQPGMSKTEVAQLLMLISTFDFRTVGEVDVDSWSLLAKPGRWQLTYAQRAVIEHYTEATADRIMPGHITRRIRDRREHFAGTYRHVECPRALVGDIPAELAWEDQQRQAHIDACMNAWAAGEDA